MIFALGQIIFYAHLVMIALGQIIFCHPLIPTTTPLKKTNLFYFKLCSKEEKNKDSQKKAYIICFFL